MHYYKRNIGDYHRKAGRLSILQHGTYMLLMDACYDREKFPTLEEAIDWSWASTFEEIEAVKFVLKKFFVEKNGVFEQQRIKEEIDKYHQNAAINKRIAIERETKRKENSTERVQSDHEPPPNHKPRTKNQEPYIDLSANADCETATVPPANPCPYQKIVDLYHKHLPMCPRVVQITDKRKTAMRARWKNGSGSLEFWEEFFKDVARSKFLTGQVMPSPGRKTFFADIDFLIRPDTAVKMQEGKYHG